MWEGKKKKGKEGGGRGIVESGLPSTYGEEG